jgi:hypothetical protein
MLPQSQGGVVDANLKVYGLGRSPSHCPNPDTQIFALIANVRVIDASVYPLQFAAHVCARLPSCNSGDSFIGVRVAAASSNIWSSRAGRIHHSRAIQRCPPALCIDDLDTDRPPCPIDDVYQREERSVTACVSDVICSPSGRFRRGPRSGEFLGQSYCARTFYTTAS